jgi:aspartate kinase
VKSALSMVGKLDTNRNHCVKLKVTVVKFGGGVIGEYGQGIPLIIRRIQGIQTEDDVGPVIVVSAPKDVTNRIIDAGRKASVGISPPLEEIEKPYQEICDQHIGDPYKNQFRKVLEICMWEVTGALERVRHRKAFEGGDRAIALAYGGELLMSSALSYVLQSHGVDTYDVPFSEWPLITDQAFEGATFLLRESEERIHPLVQRLEAGKVVTVGGFIGRSVHGRETTFERGGSDRTAIDLGLLLKPRYDVSVDLEKESIVMSADPKITGIRAEELEKIQQLSYNEARLAGQYGMKIMNPISIRDIPREVDLVIDVTNIFTGEKTRISRAPEERDDASIKLVTGRENCAILEVPRSKSEFVYGFLEGVRKYSEFTELRPYTKNGVRVARFLFFDGHYLRRSLLQDLQRISANVAVEYGLAAVTLVGDRMAQASGVVSLAYESIREYYPDLVILDGDIQRPTSSILIVVRATDKDRCVSAIHGKRAEINRR